MRAATRERMLIVRRKYSGREQSRELERLHLAQHYAIKPYMRVAELIDRLLLGTVNTQNRFATTLADLEQIGLRALPSKTPSQIETTMT